jgi:ATPase subunit of ABC transporter with duplicated ATPase domains
LFAGLSVSVGRELVGLVGRNGSGKSTLLRAIAGEWPVAAGHIACSGRVGILRQAIGSAEGSVAEALGVGEDLARLGRIETGTGDEADFAGADWTLPERIEEALAAAGLAGAALARELAGFSGGERTRLAVARLLVERADLLLLDEPTNNLDAEGRGAIARLLDRWRGGVLVASHDRALLERVDRIVALAPTGVVVHGGGWPSYVAARDAGQARADEAVEQAARGVKAMAREAQAARERQARRDRAGRNHAASGSAPKILMGRQRERAENSKGRGERQAGANMDAAGEALAAARERVEVVDPLDMELPRCGLPAGKLLLAFENVHWGVDGRAIVREVSFEVRGPERVAVSGANGAGKTSLLRLATGELVADAGVVRSPAGRLLVLDQHVTLLEPEGTLVTNLRRLNPTMGENDARAALARFGFRNAAGDRRVATLSGGERLRAGLACALSGQPVPQLLVLDEPTNHLDADGVAGLERALRGYDGAALVVSHDREFLAAIGVAREVRL